jgi:hypothetical protein
MLSRIVAVMLAAGLSFPVSAQAEEAKTALDLIYNEEAINKVLAKSNPDIGFVARLRMMKGHMEASLLNLKNGQTKVALEHVHHPRTEILADLESELKSRNLAFVLDSVAAAEAAVESGDLQAGETAIRNAFSDLAKAEASLDAAQLKSAGILQDVAITLLHIAVVEYHEAFEYSQISNIVEYQDGAFFLREAQSIIDLLAPDLKAKDPAAHAKMKSALAELAAAWPATAPPQTSVLPVTKMQALATIVELQLNKLR